MFRREDYWPFVVGVFLFGGMIALPLICGAMLDMKYETVLPGCLVACGIFVFSHTRDGKFSLARFIGAMAFLIMAIVKSAARGGGNLPAVPGGILGFLVMSGCGWAGIGLWRMNHPARSVEKGCGEEDVAGIQMTMDSAPSFVRADLARTPSGHTWACRCGELNVRVMGKCRVCGRDRSVSEIPAVAADGLLAS